MTADPRGNRKSRIGIGPSCSSCEVVVGSSLFVSGCSLLVCGAASRLCFHFFLPQMNADVETGSTHSASAWGAVMTRSACHLPERQVVLRWSLFFKPFD